MIFFDIITLVVVGLMIFRGKNDGFISQLFAIAGIAVGVALSLSYGASMGKALEIDSQYSEIVGFLVILVATVIVSLLVSKFISKTVSVIKLDWLNSILGILFSMVKGVAILSLLYTAIFGLNERMKVVDPKEFDKSMSFNVIRHLADPVLEYWEKTKPIEKIQDIKDDLVKPKA